MKRRYQQFCGLARGLDLIGERWTLLVVRELLLGPKRFGELLTRLQGLSTNLLTARLKDMEAKGLIEKRGRTYQLTPFGWELERVIFSLAQWGSQTMKDGPESDEIMDMGWLLLSTTRRYPGGLLATVEVRSLDRVFELQFTPERLFARERPAPSATVFLQVDSVPQLAGVIVGRKPWRECFEVTGDIDLWEKILESLWSDNAMVGF